MRTLRRVIGCMTGTSLDGLDVALVTTRGVGLDLEPVEIELAGESFGAEVDRMRDFAAGAALTASEIADLAAEMGRRHAALIAGRWPELQPDLVVLHGQTVTHRPPRSWQLVDPWPVAATLRCPVVFDLRSADLAARGRGAPITPLADAILYRRRRRAGTTTVVINLGGFANATLLPGLDPQAAHGFDCCPCNHLLDAASRTVLDRPYDDGGRVAAAGRPDPAAADALRTIAGRLAVEGRSGGDGDEHRDHAIAVARRIAESHGPADALATIVEAVAGSVIDAIDRTLDARTRAIGGTDGTDGTETPKVPVADIVLAGGGVRNEALVAALRRHATMLGPAITMHPDEIDGVSPIAREAAAMAILGLLAADGVAITTIRSTGRSPEVLPAGCWVHPPGWNGLTHAI